MKIKNRERQFFLSVKAANEVAKYCPDGDFNNFSRIAEGKTFTECVEIDLKVAEIMINEWEQNHAMENAGYVPDMVNLDDMRNSSEITPYWIHQLEEELIKTIARDAFGQMEVAETKEAKKNKKNTAES